MVTTIQLACSCGEVTGTLEVVKGAYFHVHCLCSDCQAFAEHLGNQDKILDEHGGSELFQTYPAYMKITQGENNIACMQLGEKGLYRWHTNCCNMPIANTMTSASVPFIGMSVKLMKFTNNEEKLATLGPVTLKAFGRCAIGEMPKDAHPKFPISFMPKIIAFMLKGLIKRKNNPSPFFINNEPIIKAKIIGN